MNLSNPVKWFTDWITTRFATSPEQAVGIAAVWYAVNKIAGNMSILPFRALENQADGGVQKADGVMAAEVPSWRLLRKEPNSYQTPAVHMESEGAKLLLSGNSRSYIHRENGRPAELIPLRHNATDTFLWEGQKWHVTVPEKDDALSLYEAIEQGQRHVLLKDDDVFHVPGFGLDGIKGMSIVKVAKRSFSIGLNQEERQEKQLRRGFVGKLIFNAPRGTLTTDEKAREFLENVKKRHDSDGEAEDVVLLRNGMTHEVINMSNKDAEFMSQKNFHRQDVALLFLLESILGDDASVSYNSLEQKNLAYLVNCLMRLLVKFEQEADRKLLTREQFLSGSHYHKFGTASLLRPDAKTTADILSLYIQNRVINPNEARGKIDMNPYEGGDTFENPNITPGESSRPEPQQPDPEASVNRIRHLLEIEQARIAMLHHDKRADEIPQWFLRWERTLGKAIEREGGCSSIATDHCTRRLGPARSDFHKYDANAVAKFIVNQIEATRCPISISA